jgi:hypothetical protein
MATFMLLPFNHFQALLGCLHGRLGFQGSRPLRLLFISLAYLLEKLGYFLLFDYSHIAQLAPLFISFLLHHLHVYLSDLHRQVQRRSSAKGVYPQPVQLFSSQILGCKEVLRGFGQGEACLNAQA